MKKEKMINNIIKAVNWELVLYNVNKITEKKATKLQLVEELSDLLNNVILTKKSQLITDFWVISYEKDENEDYILEVMFTPIVVWVDTFNQTNKNTQISRLEQRLQLALEIEDYRKAEKIKKSLDKLTPKVK